MLEHALHRTAMVFVALLVVGPVLGKGVVKDKEKADPAAGAQAQALTYLYQAQADAMAASPFGRPLLLDSSDKDERLHGDVLGVLPTEFKRVRVALEDPRRWCEILLLTPSVSGCSVTAGAGTDAVLTVQLSRRFDQPPEKAYSTHFTYRQLKANERYTAMRLVAADGPMGTSDYRFDVEALGLDDGRSVLHMTYTYRYGFRAMVAMKVYLASKGGGKVGFSSTADEQGLKTYIGGMRGSVERNVMRYYLAIEADTAPPTVTAARARFEASLDRWLASITEYPTQLPEPAPAAYRAAKLTQFGTGPR